MEIRNADSAGRVGVETGKPLPGAAIRLGPSSRVSTLDIDRAAEVARGVRAKVNELRLVRLAHIAEAISTGNYQPRASQVASGLLDAAVVDDHLQALLAAR